MSANIVVLGAGVIGLTTARLLAQHAGYKVTVIAKHMPGDYDVEYASPWAGANFLPVGAQGTPLAAFEATTWTELAKMARETPEAGIHFQNTKVYRREKDTGSPTGDWFAELVKPDAWFKDVVPDFRILSESELFEGVDGGTAFTSVCINTAIYLPWLASQCLKSGVVIKRGVVSHISETAKLHHTGQPTDLTVNCTGLGSLHLGGVEDHALHPARAQIVVVRNEPNVMVTSSGTDDGGDEVTYVMQRAAGGGTILGGSYQKNNWESQVDSNLAIRIMKRCVELCPSLVPEGKGIEALSIVRHGVGRRPVRTGGIRLERESINAPDGQKLSVVHQYGHAGYGFQTSYGSAFAAEHLVKEALERKTA